MLLDGLGALCMSGSPVFIEYDNALFLVGVYTGVIYPDYKNQQIEKSTALGIMSSLNLWWIVENECSF